MAKSLGRSSLLFAALTLVSRVLGLLRDILIARHFDSAITDAFFASLRIPNTLRRFFAEGSFTNAFVPVFSEVKRQRPEELAELLQRVCGTLLAVLLLITGLGIVGSATLLAWVAGGLPPAQAALAAEMLPIMFPYILLISLTALASAVLNSHDQFGIPALTPTLLNLTLIGACWWHRPENHGLELAWAVLLGGVLQLALQLPSLKRLGLLRRPRWGGSYPAVRKIFRLMLPTLFGSSVGQLTVLVNTALASGLVTGSISWLYYADRLVELPVSLIGVAVGVVILPRLSHLRAGQEPERFHRTLAWALRWGLLLGSAAALGLVLLAEPLLATLFLRGQFDVHDVQMSAAALQIYGPGALFLILVKILTPAFYARQDTKTPVQAGLISMGLNIALAFPLCRHYGHVGLAAATTVASISNVALLAWWRGRRPPESGTAPLLTKRFLLQVLLANGLLALLLLVNRGQLADWLALSGWGRLGRLLEEVVLGLGVYLLALWALGLRPAALRPE